MVTEKSGYLHAEGKLQYSKNLKSNGDKKKDNHLQPTDEEESYKEIVILTRLPCSLTTLLLNRFDI